MSKQTYKTLWKQIEKSRWKVTTCQQGATCWCRVIKTVDKVDAGDGPENYAIVHSGTLQKEAAQHIVKLHNKSLKQEENGKEKTNDMGRTKRVLSKTK